jgi:hypothetical protein
MKAVQCCVAVIWGVEHVFFVQRGLPVRLYHPGLGQVTEWGHTASSCVKRRLCQRHGLVLVMLQDHSQDATACPGFQVSLLCGHGGGDAVQCTALCTALCTAQGLADRTCVRAQRVCT